MFYCLRSIIFIRNNKDRIDRQLRFEKHLNIYILGTGRGRVEVMDFELRVETFSAQDLCRS